VKSSFSEFKIKTPLNLSANKPDLSLTLSLVAGVLSACGGGGSSSASATTATTPAPISASSVAPALTANQAARFLLQSQLSASDAEIASVQTLGFSLYLTNQINAPASTTGWDWLMAQGFNTSAFITDVTPVDFMMWQQLIASSDGMRKRMALALSEFFVVSSNGVSTPSCSFAMAQYWDVLVTGAFGNFRHLLEEITLNPAMGQYLNTQGNQKGNVVTGRAPDENFAREVMQLFTIGLYQLNLDGTNTLLGGLPIETYAQTDVTQLAQVFTGWNLDPAGNVAVTNPLSVRSRMIQNAVLHETAAVTFLGVTIPANTNGAVALGLTLDALFNHPNVAPFFSKQLIQRLVTSNPSSAYVARVASIFNDNGSGIRGDLKAVFVAVLLDTEARSDAQLAVTTWGKLREPMLRYVQWARTFGATSPTGKWNIEDMSSAGYRLGQSPLRAVSVFNFFRPGHVPPNTALAAQGLTAPEFQLMNESSVAGYANSMMSDIVNGHNSSTGGLAAPAYVAELALATTPVNLVNRLNLLLCAGQLSAASQNLIQTAISTIDASTVVGQQNRVYSAILLVMVSPDYLIQK
jgi:uncharacterized protein (DUF1800 family)